VPKSALGPVLLLVAYVSGQAPAPNPGGRAGAERNQTGILRQIIPGHYIYSYATFNSGIIVTSEGLVVLDALNSEAVSRGQREAMASAIREPVRVLVSSTFHNNYSKGNIAYADVLKIGHELYRTDLLDLMRRENVPEAEQTARLPNQTFRDRMTLYRGGKEIQILHVGRAHTRGDSIIYVPQDRIACLSELYLRSRNDNDFSIRLVLHDAK
jgi:glyoxylase-like metal-dependent hydrolase (beta-lactamase superfamily II)